MRDLPPPAAVAQEQPPAAVPRRAPLLGARAAGAGGQPPQANAIDSAMSQFQALAPPSLSSTAFEGLDNGNNIPLIGGAGLTPPDPQIAVGPDHILEMVNVVGRVYTKSGGMVQTFALADLFQVPPGYFDFDPKVIYDAPSGRWFAAYASYQDNPSPPDEGRLHIAVSQTSDPTGDWNVYFVSYADVFPDNPGIGVTDDKLTASSNVFDIDYPNGSCPNPKPCPLTPGCGAGDAYCGEQTVVFEKADLLPASLRATWRFPTCHRHHSIQPASPYARPTP